MRLIDADAGVDLLRRMAQNYRNIGIHKDAEDLGIIAEMLDKPACFPTIDAAPVVHAMWVPVTGKIDSRIFLGCTAYKCSVCGRMEEENSEPYCHCGAKMDAKEAEHGQES